MCRTTAGLGAHGDWTYSETIDEDHSAITVSGRVDRLGADLLRGTIEELRRRGHHDITVTFEHPDTIDASANEVLIEVAEWLTGLDGRLLIRWSACAHGGRVHSRRTVAPSSVAPVPAQSVVTADVGQMRPGLRRSLR